MKEKYSLGEIELISCCLDDELTPDEKERLQARLRSDPELQKKYSELQRTRTILRNTPKRKTPRNFTLPAEVIKPRLRIPSFASVLRFSSITAALGLVFLLAFEFLPIMRSEQTGQAEDARTLMASAPVEESIEAPMIITWGAPINANAYGIGGGGGDAPPVTSYIIPREGNIADAVPMEIQPAEPPVITAEQPLMESAPQQPRELIGIELSGSQPLLGVRPLGERGKMEYPVQPVEQPSRYEGLTTLRIAQIILGVVAILFAIISFLPQGKRHSVKQG